MKIVDKSKFNRAAFSSLDFGDVFRDPNGDIYMKIPVIYGRKAVCLQSGLILPISEDEIIEPLDCELVIK